MIRATLTIGLVCFAFVGQAVANPKLDVWLEMMKLTHSCKENVKHRTARDTALNLAERLRPEEDLKSQVSQRWMTCFALTESLRRSTSQSDLKLLIR